VLAHKTELVHVLGAVHRGRLDDSGLRVVLVVEGAYGAARLEAVREGGDVVVHLRAPLLAVVDDVEADFLEQSDGVDDCPILYFRQFGFAESTGAKQIQEALVSLDLESTTPPFRLADVGLLERPAGEGLHAPGRLAQAADLAGEEADLAHRTLRGR
jgi:hypothetical protein